MQKINRVSIKNFRQFKDVSLRFDDEKGIYLFEARTGSGKSNFLNAICWCLYEAEPFRASNEKSPILHEETSKINPFEEVEVSIEVQAESKTLLFTRTKRETQQSYLTVKVKSGGDWPTVPDPEVVVENFLPKDLMNFFLFDGESVQNLFRGNYSEKLKDSVWKVSNVELLDNGIDHLTNLKKTISQRVGNEDSRVNDIQADIDEIEKNIARLSEDLDKEKKEREDSQIKRKEYREKSNNLAQFKSETARRKQLEDEHDRLSSELLEINQNINKALIEDGLYAFLVEALIGSSKAINETKKKGELPPKIRGDFITELVESNNSCICGRHIGEEEKKHLLQLMEDNSALDKRAFLQDELYEINSFIKTASALPGELTRLRKTRGEKELLVEKINREIDNINQKLRNVDDQEMADIERFIEKLDNLISESSIKISNYADKLEMLKSDKKSKDSELKNLIEQDKKNVDERKKMEFLEKNIAKLEEIRVRIIERVRKTVSYNANEYFKELIWKKDTFEKVNFEDDYKVTVLKRGQEGNALKTLSTGETKVLGFATIKALTSISGFGEMPVFIDGALEYLDEGVQEKFLSSLPSFLPDKQLFIFSPKRREIREFAAKYINKNNYFEIVPDEDKCSTEVRRMNG